MQIIFDFFLIKENYQFSKEESMVFLKSSYSAVGIYYLTNNYLIAQCTAKDSMYTTRCIRFQ